MSIINNGLLLASGADAATTYQISRSIRLNAPDSAYFSRTPSSAGNRKTWTWSAWVKRARLGTEEALFACGTSTNDATFGQIIFSNSDTLRVNAYGTTWRDTAQVFRDCSAWYHIVVAFDTTQSTANDRVKVYVNGQQVTYSANFTNPTQNTDYAINQNIQHTIGRYDLGGGGNYLSAYLADIYFLDGTATDPSTFAQTDAVTGQWVPKTPTGISYGTNGFRLTFSDNSGTTSTTLGKDAAGSNNWSPNNFSVASGSGNDSLTDSPTSYGTDAQNGGEVRGNYCTLNPLSTTAGTYTQGNLRYEGANADRRSNGTIAVSTGKWYWEVTLGNAPSSPRVSGGQYNAFGFGLSTAFNSTTGPTTLTDAVVLMDNGYYKNFSGANTDGGTAFASGDVLSCAVDLDANTFTFRRNNTQIVTGTIGGTAGRELVPIVISYSGAYGVMDCNFGARQFSYTAPSGFKALCDTNLGTPTIIKPSTVMDVKLYTGNGSSQAITGLGFNPDFLWIKQRSGAQGHALMDAVRGADKRLFSEGTFAEDSVATLTSFDTSGFTVSTAGGASTRTNESSQTYVAWCWDAGTTTTTINANAYSAGVPSITSSVRANASAGFSIVTWTGNGTAGATVGHSLGAAPSLIILKRRSGSGNSWGIYHSALGATKVLQFDTNSAFTDTTSWNDTAPTSTVFSLGTSLNTNTGTYVAYCFAPVTGYSSFGSYVGNGSSDGVFVYTGFRPKWVMIKASSSTGDWYIIDTSRDTYNLSGKSLQANTSNAEPSVGGSFSATEDILSNGFKLRDGGSGSNGSSVTYVYAAFAENPFQYARAR